MIAILMNLYVESCTRVYRGLERGLLSKADTGLVFGRVRNWRSREFGRSGSNCVGVWAERRGARAEVKGRPTFPPTTTTRDQTTQQAQFIRYAYIRLRACKPHNLVRAWSIWLTWPATLTQAVILCLSLPHVRRYQVWLQAAEYFTTNISDEDLWHAVARYPVIAFLRVRLVHAHFRGL